MIKPQIRSGHALKQEGHSKVEGRPVGIYMYAAMLWLFSIIVLEVHDNIKSEGVAEIHVGRSIRSHACRAYSVQCRVLLQVLHDPGELYR